MKILIIDNYDSFTYNLVQLVKENSSHQITVLRNDAFELNELNDFDKIILSPGPGLPLEAGLMPDVVRVYAESKPILGVCLGHQCIGEIFGAKLKNLSKVVHGKGMETKIIGESYLFKGLPETITTGRYHSWVVDDVDFPDALEVTAVDSDNVIMALKHKVYDVQGVQFHPESVLTPEGKVIIRNWLEHA